MQPTASRFTTVLGTGGAGLVALLAWLVLSFGMPGSGVPGLAVAAARAQSPAPVPDALDDALALAGFTRDDVGWRAQGWWERYPADIPYKLRHFDDMCASPLAVVPFARVMGHTAVQFLTPEWLGGKKGNRGAGALYLIVHNLGVNKRFGATRAYSANLTAEPTPLPKALLQAWAAEGRAVRFKTFGNDSPYPLIPQDLETACRDLPPDVSAVLGQLVLNLLEARRWAVLAFRNVPLDMRYRIVSRLDLGEEETDALEYEPAIDDAAGAWDQASLWYAGLKTVESLDTARLGLADPVRTARNLSRVHIDIKTPVGRVIVNGTGGNAIDVGTGAFLVVDLGGDDTYTGPVGASNPRLPVGAALDLSGNDTYEGGDMALGAGATGIGVLLDAAGNDRYSAGTLGEGAGHFGLGVLADLAGRDVYSVHYSGQGAGFFGIGMLVDAAGDDAYTVWSDGQGFGGVAGVGTLVDRAGNDTYLAEPDPAVTGRPSYHTEGKISVSNAQGCGMGRRGDGSDGHSWAGGLGTLIDAEGDDRYTIGNWGQGCGYWFGTGIVWDGAGNDEYRANGWASASGAHFCIGAVVDEGGDDLHQVDQTWGPAFGHDFTVAVLLDAAGNDTYVCGGDGMGYSINRSVALCLEGGGDDTYRFGKKDGRPGVAVFETRMLDRNGRMIYWTEPSSVGLFLDVAGRDVYPAGAANDAALTDPPDSDNARARNRGIFVDRADGVIDLDRPYGGKPR